MDACSALLRTLTDPPSVMRPQTVIHHAHAQPQPTTGRRRRRRPSQDSVQGQSSREHQQQHQQQHRQQEPHHNQHHPHHRPHHQHPHQHAPVAWQPSWLTLLVLGHVFVGVADGCIRRSIFEPQTSTSPPVMEEPPTSTISPSNKELCREDEDLSTGCLHGGTCYAIVLNEGIRQTFCQCLTEWTGRRCQLAFIDPGILAIHDSQMRTANIAAGVSVCILIVFVLLLAVFVYLRTLRRKKQSQSTTRQHDEQEMASLEPNGRHTSTANGETERNGYNGLFENLRHPTAESPHTTQPLTEPRSGLL